MPPWRTPRLKVAPYKGHPALARTAPTADRGRVMTILLVVWLALSLLFALGLLPQFVKNIFEEAAWRGYLAPKVYSLHLNDFAGHLIVGLVWGAWHIPYYLFFLDRALLHSFTTLDLAIFIPLAIVVMISWAMVYGEIRLLTNSIWPAVLMHMVEDAFLNQLFTARYIQIMPGRDWLVSPVNGLISVCLFIALGVGLRQWRKRKCPLPEMPAPEATF
jgi:membrane protease YdiL (CAAX protease family)